MQALILTEKESEFLQCAHMILNDQCPPSRKHYLCMKQEDDTGDCSQCWINYLWDIGAGKVKVPTRKKEAI